MFWLKDHVGFFIKASLLSIFVVRANTQLVSPCPRLFSYEPQKENDRWYGVITLISESDLSGVWLRVIFDRPSLQLGNWFGEIVTTDNKEYLIKNPMHQIKSNMPYALRFYIKYDPADPAPQLIAFRLNAKTVCPEGETTTPAAITGGQLQTSNQLSSVATTTPITSIDSSADSVFSRPGVGWIAPVSAPNDDDDVFAGDFQLINKPQLKPIDFECGTVVRQKIKRQTSNTPYQRGFGNKKDNLEVFYLNEQGEFIPSTINKNLNQFITTLLNNLKRDEFNPIVDDLTTTEAQPKPLITYGQSTREGEFPWHAALYHERGADLQYICGASLISDKHVLTVAHCVTRRRSQTTLNPDSLVVYLGKYYLKKWSNPGIQDSQVSLILAHPNYNSQTYANDIALIKLLNPVSFSDYVRPICLWADDTDLNSVLNKPGTVVGWGFDHTGKVTEELTQAKMPVVAKETCIYSFPDFFSRFTTSKTYCAGFRNGTSVCNGDSGGGMVFPKPTLTPGRKVWQLRGLVSISVALQNQFRCDSSHYVVFTDVAKYLDWIKASMQR